MNFSLFMPVDIRSGIGCVKENASCFALGSHALIVTGHNGAKRCGALDDVTDVLVGQNIGYTVFSEIEENPLLSVCYKGGQVGAQTHADFVIGIGGGSVMDAAKAIAAFAANPAIAPKELFSAKRNPSLPMILIPTTAGTGSEANPYAVMSLDGENVKKTFTDREQSYAKYALLDARYLASLSPKYMESCAMDAFAHCCESYLSPKANEVSRMFAGFGARILYAYLKQETKPERLSLPELECLMSASCAGGIAINRTGTGFPHPLGYNLTMYLGVPHGYACGMFYGEYLSYNEKSAPELCASLYEAIGASGEEIKQVIPARADMNIRLDAETVRLYVDKVKGAGNYKNSPYVISPDEMAEIYTRLFVKESD